jgi:hypothetical protein
MTKDEALKMALESHKDNERHNTNAETKYWCEQYRMLCEKILEALEQPAQEPVAWIEVIDHHGHKTSRVNLFDKGLELANGTNLYTHPHQWQGLTSEDINKITDELNISLILSCDIIDFVMAIEAKLKEKNHG